MPKKLETYLPLAITPFSYFCAVPVFPPTRYPSKYAGLPVPLDTTLSKANLTVLLVSRLITLVFTAVGFTSLMISPVSGSRYLLTICGLYRVPPFSMADTAVTCCIGVQ